MNQSTGEKFNIQRTQPYIQKVKKINEGVKNQTKTANKRNSKVSGLQLELWNRGFFKGIKDRHGKEATYETAVDGITGKMTRQAIKNAKKAGYNIDDKIGLTKQQKPIQEKVNSVKNDSLKSDSIASQQGLSFLNALKGNLSNGMLSYKDSQNQGEQAIADHKIKLNVNDPYLLFDKKNQRMRLKVKDQVLYEYPITLGKTIGDGLPSLETRYVGDAPGTTGAGIFTVGNIKPTSNYIGNEPIFQLYPDSVNQYISQSLHSPAGVSRIQALRNPNSSKRVQSGCMSPDCGVLQYLYDNGLIHQKDSAYVLPEVDGNRLIEKNARLQMEWGNNNPETYKEKNGTIRKFRYNNKK